MKNLGSDLIVNGNKVDKSLKTDDVLAMGRLLSPPIHTSHHPPPPPPPPSSSTHHNENNTEGKQQQQVNLLVNFNNGVVGGGGGYFSLPRRTSPNGKPNWLLTSWPERLNNGDCRTCLSHDKTSSHLRTTSSTTSLNLITEIKGDSKVYMLPNGTTTTTPSPPHCPSSPPLANLALKSSFDPLDLCCAGRMVRSHSLGLDLPIRTNGDGCEYECPVTNQSSDRTECVFSSPSVPTPPLTLSAVLENIPIVYDPQTKKLHIIEVKESRNDSVFEVPINNNNNNNNNNEEQEFQCSDSNVLLECGHPVVPIKLNRVSTSGSLPSSSRGASGGGGGECSSSEFSSVSSLSTEFSSTALEDQLVETNNHNHHQQLRGSSNSNCGSYVDSIDENGSGFIEINLDRHSITSRSGLDSEGGGGGASSLENADLDAGSLDECLGISQGAKPKRRGITGFLSRNLLSWKSRDVNNSATNNNHEVQHQQHVGGGGSSSSSWKLFSRLPPLHQECLEKDNSTTCKNIEEYHHVQQQSVSKTPRSRRSDDLVASSTTALILENRPLNLPAKAPEEELKHKLEYKQMVEAAKRRELKEAKLRKKYLQRQLKHEEQLSLASKIWNIEILPNWDSMRQCRKARDLWWRGIPPSVRGKVWKLAIGNDLHVTPELYEICVCRAKDRIRMAAESISVSEDDVEAMTDKEGSVELIKLDVSRTFPQLCIFQKGGPYYDMLHSLLGAYVCYRPDVGYVQGMSFLAAVLILNLEVADAFICFANLLNQPCQLAFFRLDEPMMRSYFLAYKEFFRENMPNLFEHFCSQNLSPDLYLIDWIYTLYSRSLPLDVASRVWDVYFRDGDEFLFRTALGILRQYEDLLLCMDFIHVAQFLTKLPEDMMAEPLFKSIESIRMVSEKRNFAQVLATHTDSKLT